MTIALGILANDGVVIAADTQETTEFSKTESYKIYSRVVEDEERAISISGAGDAGYLDVLMQDIAKAFIDTRDPADVEQKLRAACHAFHSAHIIPMKVPEHLRPRVVAGLHWKKEATPSFLMTNAGSAMSRQKRPVAVGFGQPHASILLGRALPEHPKDTPVQLAALVAAYTIFRVKNSTEGCGLGTHVTVLTDGHGKHFARSTIKALEEHFETYEALENSLFGYVIGRPLRDLDGVPGLLARWARDTRNAVRTAPADAAAARRGGIAFNDEHPGQIDAQGCIQLFSDAVVRRSSHSVHRRRTSKPTRR
jgi:hypothetical protein